MRVTIAIPTFRRVGYLRQAVESAQRQSHAALQIIVSDNASDDGTAEYLETLRADARVLVLRQTENLGMVGNWNACLRAADGAWFLLLSDDDYLEPDAIAAMLRACEEAAEPERVGMVYCRSRTVDGTGQTVSVGPAAPGHEEAREFAMQYFERRRVVFPCSILLRTRDLQALGYRAEGIKLGCDAIAWSEVALGRGAVACAQEVLSNYRVHANNLTSTASLGYWIHDLRVLLKVWEQALCEGGRRGAAAVSAGGVRILYVLSGDGAEPGGDGGAGEGACFAQPAATSGADAGKGRRAHAAAGDGPDRGAAPRAACAAAKGGS